MIQAKSEHKLLFTVYFIKLINYVLKLRLNCVVPSPSPQLTIFKKKKKFGYLLGTKGTTLSLKSMLYEEDEGKAR